LSMERIEGGPAVEAGPSRIIGRRIAIGTAILLATVGVWAIALWSWLDGGALKARVSDVVRAHTPSVSVAADRSTQAPLVPQSRPATATVAGRDPQAAPVQQLAPPDNVADRVIQVPSAVEWSAARTVGTGRGMRPPALTTASEITTAVVRGSQPAPAPGVLSDNGPAVVRGNQASASDSGPAVVRGTRAPAGPSSP
jgi:hypothetical protein